MNNPVVNSSAAAHGVGHVLAVEGLAKTFAVGRDAHVRAVDDVSFTLDAGRTLALVGESGCGKTTTTRLVTRLLDADAGLVRLGGVELTTLRGRRLREARRHLQIVFQNPTESLDPRWSVERIVAEPLRAHGLDLGRVPELLDQVGLESSVAVRYPAELSTGQRQRVALARALAPEPEVLVLDEPVSALDVSVRAQILNVLVALQRERGLAYLFVTHDLALVPHVAHETAVMYAGRIVEHGPTSEVIGAPRHPYTRALLDAIPVPDPSVEPYRPDTDLGDRAQSASERPTGCTFRLRCPKAQAQCAQKEPTLSDPTSADTNSRTGPPTGDAHPVACFFPLDPVS